MSDLGHSMTADPPLTEYGVRMYSVISLPCGIHIKTKEACNSWPPVGLGLEVSGHFQPALQNAKILASPAME